MINYFLLAITAMFVVINFLISDKDFLHPAVLFCLTFFASVVMCILNQESYAISFSGETFIVLTIGFICMTVINYLFNHGGKSIRSFTDMGEIHVPAVIEIFALVIQVLATYYFWVYLRNLSLANGSGLKLSEMIATFDNLSKFQQDTLYSLHVTIPMVFRICNPISEVIGYIALYFFIHNFLAAKKIDFLPLLSILLLIISCLMSGSRSPLFRIFTFAIIQIYIYWLKQHKHFKISYKTFLICSVVIIVAWIIAFSSMKFMGRDVSHVNIKEYIFIYLGSPLLNLDTFIRSHSILAIGQAGPGLFGSQTFGTLYAYIAKLLKLPYPHIENLHVFIQSPNGIDTGNVYTTYMPFIYDFGIFGMIPAVLFMCFYYVYSYKIIMKCQTNKGYFELFIYAYLFNDLLMLPFASRFYNTILSPGFIKFFLISVILWLINRKKSVVKILNG